MVSQCSLKIVAMGNCPVGLHRHAAQPLTIGYIDLTSEFELSWTEAQELFSLEEIIFLRR